MLAASNPWFHALLGLLLVTPLQAVSVAIVNPGFEDISGESPFNEFTFGPLNGWDLYDPDNVTDGGDGPQYWIGTLRPTVIPAEDPVNHQFFPGGAPEGSRVAIAYNVQAAADGGEYGLSQTLSETLQANMTYTLTALVGNIASGVDLNSNAYNLNGFPGYRIDLLAGSTLLSTVQTINPTIPEGEFRAVQYQYTSSVGDPIGENLVIRLVNLNQTDLADPTADIEVDFDQIELDVTPVPEPAAWWMLALGAITAACRRPAVR